ncbi:MAG TPA: glycosyltransferase, partial [Roseiflexaceae bacterium]|nr:glycosyltransferase [Roseiflexaceae bacterium]
YAGILNGVDYCSWNPAIDQLSPARYLPEDLRGKGECKRELQARMGLDTSSDTPIVGVVSRLVSQKGLDLLAAAIGGIMDNMRVQFAILGSGDNELEALFGQLPARYPGRVGSYIGFDNRLAHLIEAGSDFFLMPSIYEPCGLNQMYSLKYGTLPIVRATGGLDDSIMQYDEASGTGTGFKFHEPSPHAIYYAVGWAVSTYFDRPQHMHQLIQNAMAQDFSWERSAQSYEWAYARAMANKRRL